MTDRDLAGALRRPLLLVAFEGFDDAAEAACGLVEHLEQAWEAPVLRVLDSEEYYDFQVNRPHLRADDQGKRSLHWPTARVAVARPTTLDRDVVLVTGPEPNLRWRSFAAWIGDLCTELGVETLVLLGGLLGDTPHTRPCPVEVSADPATADRRGLQRSTYEGPTGIVEVLADQVTTVGLAVLSCWVGVPHYAPVPPCPKATLALLGRVEELCGVSLPVGDLPEEARAWQRGVDELTAEDDEVAGYVADLEQAHDTADHPEASGEAIAREFQRYLRRRDGGEGSAR